MMKKRKKKRRKAGKRLWSRRMRRRALVLACVLAFTGLVATWVFHHRVGREFQVLRESVPTRYMARPLVLRPGLELDASQLEGHLVRLRYEPTNRSLPRAGEFRLRGRDLRIGRRAVRLGDYFDPGGFIQVRFDRRGSISRIRDADGENVPSVLLDPEWIGRPSAVAHGDRIEIPLEQIPEHLIKALLTVEDRRFFEHGALDPRRIAGAIVSNVRSGELAEGGSTLTQQLARTLFSVHRQDMDPEDTRGGDCLFVGGSLY